MASGVNGDAEPRVAGAKRVQRPAWKRPGGGVRAVAAGVTRILLVMIAVGIFGPASAEAKITATLEAHLPGIVQWVYRNGAVETSHPCEAVCSELWSEEEAGAFGQSALDSLHQVESSIPLWGTTSQLSTAINASWKLFVSSPSRVGWHIENGSMPAASKWVELSGAENPGCGSIARLVLGAGEVWRLVCEVGGETAWLQVRHPTKAGCGHIAPPPAYPGFTLEEFSAGECYEGEGVYSALTEFKYSIPMHVVSVQDWTGQVVPGEGNNVRTYGGEDPGISAVTKKLEASLSLGGVLGATLEWLLEGSHGPNPSGADPAETLGEDNPAAPDESRCMTGHPVNCSTGNQTETQQDLAVGGRGPALGITRSYNSQLAAKETSPGPFGYGWTSSFSAHVDVDAEQGNATVLNDDGSAVRFIRVGATWLADNPLVEATLSDEGSGYLYTLPDQTQLHFNSSGQLASENDRNGNTLTMTRGASGRLEAITDGAGRKITLSYNGEGLVESAKDPIGRVVKYVYESGDLASVTLPGESSPRWQFKYDGSHELTSETDGRGHSITTEYDGEHRVIFQSDALERQRKWNYEGSAASPKTTITEPNGSRTVEEFDERGQPTSVTRAAGTGLASTTMSSYDEAGRLDRLTDPDGHVTTYSYDQAGDRLGETNALGNSRNWAYNSTHDIVSETTPKGETTTIERDAHGNATAVSRAAPGSKTQAVRYKYGPHGELESTTDPLERTWDYEYDSYGDRAAEIDPEGDKRTWKYNEDSEEISTVSPRGHVSGTKESSFATTIERDAQGRTIKVTDPLKHVTKYAYDASGNLESETDPEGNVTSYTYDADDEPTKVDEPSGTTTETEYDEGGQVIAQIDGNKHTTKYVRNALGDVTEVVDPLGRRMLKEYDGAGNLTKLTDAAKRTTTYAYDAANQLDEVSYSDGKTPTVKYEYDADGDRIEMVDGTGTSKYTYDQLDRLTESKDGHGDIVEYEYELANEPVKITYPGGKSVSRTFDKDGRLESVTDWLGSTTKFGYDADSDQTSTTFPSATADVDQYAYEDDDAMEATTMKKATEALASIEYSRNKDSQVTKATTKGLPGEEKPAFSYDENSRLSKGAGVKYAYDGANNPTTLGSDTYAYNSADELEGATYKKETVTAYAYDELGERAKTTPSTGAATTYGYDQAGNVTSVTRPKSGETPAIADAYGYNGVGLRASQTIGASTSYMTWAEGEAVPRLLSDEARSFIYGPGGVPIEQINNSTGAVQYLHHDQSGSTRLLTGSTGKTEATFTYGPYGELTGSTGTATTPLGYDGQYRSSDTGLVYLRNRVYDPKTAQFLSVDPLVSISGAPYSYAGDNPLTYGDSVGLMWTPLAGGAGGADAACGATIEIPGVDIGTCGAAGIATGAAVVGAAVGVVTAIAGEEGGDEGEAELKAKEAERENCGNPATPPGSKFEWKGKGPVGSNEGSWWDPDTRESLHPDLGHEEPIGPHYDYTAPDGSEYRIYPDGRIEPTKP